MKKVILMSLIIVSISLVFADFTTPANFGYFNPNYQLESLLNPNKVKMSHTMSFSSGVSSSGQGFYQSAYTNHLKFDLKENLKLNLDLSFVNQGTMTHNNNFNIKGNNDNQNLVIPSFSMEYQPFENTKIYFEYRQVNGSPFQSQRRNDFPW